MIMEYSSLGKPTLGVTMVTVNYYITYFNFDYCNAFYLGLTLKSIEQLQLVQNAAARLLTGAGYREPINPLLQQLYWLPVCFWA